MKVNLLFSHSVMPNSLWPHGLQHARLPSPSLSPGVCSNSCPWSQWCHPTISSSSVRFSFCLQSFPTLGSFQMSWIFASGGQSIGASASTSVLPVDIRDWFPLGWTSWISLQTKGLSRIFSNPTVQRHHFFGTQPSFWSSSHIHTCYCCCYIALVLSTLCDPMDGSTPGSSVPGILQARILEWVAISFSIHDYWKKLGFN